MKRIKKCLLFLFLIMLFIPLTVQNVSAATCADVKAVINKIEKIDIDITELKCSETASETVLSQCSSLQVEKTSLIENLFNYRDEKVCPSQDKNISSVLSNYKSTCTNEFSSKFKDFVESIFNLFYISAPFILIIFGSLDFFKIVTGSPDKIKKHRQDFIKRVIAFTLLYTTPFFVKTIFSITPYSLNTNQYTCAQEISLTPKLTSKTVTGYYSEDNYGGGGTCGAKIVAAAKKNAAFAKSKNFRWCDGRECPLSCSVKTCYTEKNSHDSTCCATLVTTSVYQAGLIKASEVSMMHSAGGTSENLNKHGFKFIKYTNEKSLKPGDILVYACKDGGCRKTKLGDKTLGIGHVAIYAGNGKQYDHGTTDSIRSGGYKNFWSNSSGKYLYGVLRCSGN